MTITLEEFNAYSGNYEEGEEVNSLKLLFLSSAKNVVENYLRRSVDDGDGDGDRDGDRENTEGETDAKSESGAKSENAEGETNANEPLIVKLTILRIATLMLSETDGNIGLSGRTFGDASRTFISYSNYKKYLEPLSALREPKF